MKCPICKKTELEDKALICPECKANSPYSLLEGFSPVKKVSDELKKSEGRKKRNTMLTLLLAGAIVLFIGSVVYAIAIKKKGTVVETVVDEEAIEDYKKENAELSSRIQELDKYKEENSKLMAEVKELKEGKSGNEKIVVDKAAAEKHKAENAELTAKMQGLQKYKVLYEKEFYVYKGENTKLKSEIEELKKRKPVSAEKPVSKEKVASSEEAKKYKEKSSKLSAEIAEYKKETKISEAKISELNNEIHNLKQQLGDKSKLLTKAKSQSKSQGGTTTYIVKDGDNLFSIAQKFYGSGFKYKKIAADNNITDPDAIRKGQSLTIYR